MTECIICDKTNKKKTFDYTFFSIDKLCNKCKEKKIKHIIEYEQYRYNSCHGGC